MTAKDRYGEWPPAGWWAQAHRPLSIEKLREIDNRLRNLKREALP